MAQNLEIQERLARLRYERELQQKEFPIRCLLRLYSQCQQPLRTEYFAGMQELIRWLSPISRSEKQICYIPTYLLTYEAQELARLTGHHASQIYQELLDLWTQDSRI